MLRVLLLAAAVAATPLRADTAFSVPKTYEAEAIISLPYANIAEPVHIWYDGVNNMSRIEYYGGQDTYLYRPDMLSFGIMFQIVPENNQMMCVQNNGTSDGPVTPQGLLPDLTEFELKKETDFVKGIECNVWEYTYKQNDRKNTYQFYASAVTGAPVLFHFMGFDELFGSHYDEYKIDYQVWRANATFAQGIFQPPNMTCGGFPGPGEYGHSHDRTVAAELSNLVAHHERIETSFATFVAKYGKTYEHDLERTFRKGIFLNFLRYIDSVNRNNKGFTLAMNHLGDLKRTEHARMRGVRSSRPVAEARLVEVVLGPSNSSFDWRDKGAVSPVKDQGICGSCYSFGSAEAFEGAWFLSQGSVSMMPLSQQAIMDCSWAHGNNGCDGGESFRVYDWVLENGGFLPSESAYGVYMMADGFCHVNSTTEGAKLKGYVNVTSGSQQALATSLMASPVSVAIDASHLDFSFYSSGVYYNADCGNTSDALDHEVLAIGWGIEADKPYWWIKNSWSEYWGDEGYVKMSMENNNCGVATDATQPLV